MKSDIYDKLISVAETLKLDSQKENLLLLKNISNEKTCFVAFIGQFSAGKSSLINNIIGKDILPHQLKSSTPLLTYIRYGNEEKALLHWVDGSIKTISIHSVSKIIQENHNFDFSKLDYLELFVNCELLKSGLILLDTPGLNSLYSRHEALLANSMNLASKVMYVVKGARTQVDVEKIKTLNDLGLPTCLIRTHCDEIRPKLNGEKLEDFIKSDREVLNSNGLKDTDCYYVSNIKDSEYYKNIIAINDNLLETGKNIEAVIEKSSKAQAEHVVEQLEKQVNFELINYKKLKESGDRAEKLGLQRIAEKINEIKQHLRFRNEKLNENINKQKNYLKRNADAAIASALEDAKKNIAQFALKKDDRSKMKILLESEHVSVLKKVLESVNNDVSSKMKEINGEFVIEDFGIDSELVPEFEDYNDYLMNENEEIIAYRERLNNLKKELGEIKDDINEKFSPDKCKELLDAINEAQDLIKEAKSKNDAYPEYEPQKILLSEGDTSVSDCLKTIGSIADWALLFCPGETIAKAVGKVVAISESTVKIITGADKAKDGVFALNKIWEGMKKTIVNKRRIDKAKKIIDGAKNIHGEIKNSPFASMLDWLTIEHWAGKIGSWFDTPPEYGYDQEYEAQWQKEKNELVDNCIKAAEISVTKKKEYGFFKSALEEQQAKEKAKSEAIKAAEKEMETAKQRIKAEAEVAALNTWCENCANWFVGNVKPELESNITEFLAKIPQKLEEYCANRNQALLEELQKQKNMYDEMLNKPVSEIDLFIEKHTALLEELQDIKSQIA